MKHILGSNSRSKLTNVLEGDCQPNAVDLRLDKVFEILPTTFEISDEHKKHRETKEITPDQEGYFNLTPGSYEVTMLNQVSIGENEAGWVIVRSTLNRAGCFLTSGNYDSFYGIDTKTNECVGGVMAGCLHVNVGLARIKKGTRVGQFLLFDAEMLTKYDGDYGNHKQHDKKYN